MSNSEKIPGSGKSIAPRAGRREWIGLAVIALPCVLYAMDLTVLNLAIPHLSADLKPSSSQLLWIVDIYGFLVAGFLITMGTLGDRIGRRKLLMIGAAAFGIASVIAAFSNSANMLIAARALLGIAGATLAPSTLSLIRNMFHDPGQRTAAIGIWAASYSVGGAIGPLIGGAMLEHFWWGSVFLIAVPVMVLLLVLGPLLLPEYRDPNAGRIDIVSAMLSLIAVLSVIFGLKKIAENGFGTTPLLVIGIGVIVGYLFLRRQQSLSDPLIDLRLFRLPAFSASLTVYTLCAFIMFGFFLFFFQYLQLVQGLSPLQSGLWALPSFVGFVLGSLIAPVIAKRTNPTLVITFSLAFATIGFGILTQVDGNSGLGILVAGSFIYSVSLSPVVILATDLIVGSAPPERAGIASAISETGAEFGGALGIAILGSIGTAIYRTRMANGIPENVPSAIADTAKDTLGGALAEAGRLAEPVRSIMINEAKEAFILGFQLTALIGAVVVAGLAILAGMRLRKLKIDQDEPLKDTELEPMPG